MGLSITPLVLATALQPISLETYRLTFLTLDTRKCSYRPIVPFWIARPKLRSSLEEPWERYVAHVLLSTAYDISGGFNDPEDKCGSSGPSRFVLKCGWRHPSISFVSASGHLCQISCGYRSPVPKQQPFFLIVFFIDLKIPLRDI